MRQTVLWPANGDPMRCAFVDKHKIDSYLKLRVLLSMHKQPQHSLSLDELCERFFVADRRALEQLVADLCQRGLLTCDAEGWRGNGQPDISYCLACLERTFDDPLARQRLLDQVVSRKTGHVN